MSEAIEQLEDNELKVIEVTGCIADGDVVMKLSNGDEALVSRQIFDDQFNYDQYKCASVPYNLDALLYFFENNTWHARCCRLKAACTVGLGFGFLLRDGQEQDLKEQQELIDFFENTHPEETFLETMDKFELDYETVGNAYLEIIRNLSGKIVGIYHIPANTMRVRSNMDGYVQMRDTRYVFFKKYGDKRIWNKKGEINNSTAMKDRASEIYHRAQYSPRNSFYGVPEWLPAMSAMFGSEKAEDFNIQFFENNAVPQFAIIVKKAKLGSDVKKVIAEYFRKHIKGKNHKTLVLEVPGEGEIEMKELAGDTKDASYRLYRLDNRDEVIAAHGVPPRMVGIISPGALGGKGDPDSQKEIFLTQIIAPRQASLNNRINKMLLNNGLNLTRYKFAFNKMNATDASQDSEIYERYVKLGIYSINQVLDKLGEQRLDPDKFPGADEHYIFTSSGPILVSKLIEYMEVSLVPNNPSPPGLPGGSGVTANSNAPKRKESTDE